MWFWFSFGRIPSFPPGLSGRVGAAFLPTSRKNATRGGRGLNDAASVECRRAVGSAFDMLSPVRRILVPLFVALVGVAHAAALARPNIVVLLADDLGYRDIGCYGVKDIRTPALDRLAAKGVKFTQFYSNGQEGSPTRTALMTGRY